MIFTPKQIEARGRRRVKRRKMWDRFDEVYPKTSATLNALIVVIVIAVIVGFVCK